MGCRWYSTILCILILSACIGTPSGAMIEVQDAWARAVTGVENMGESSQSSDQKQPSMGMNGAVYMVLRNNGDAEDKLLYIKGDIAQSIELHISEMKDGIMSMHPVDGVEVPPKEQVEFKPGGLHVMLIGLRRDLNPGDQINLVLVFEKNGEIPITVEVRLP
jgi:copper(I)-binding protein